MGGYYKHSGRLAMFKKELSDEDSNSIYKKYDQDICNNPMLDLVKDFLFLSSR